MVAALVATGWAAAPGGAALGEVIEERVEVVERVVAVEIPPGVSGAPEDLQVFEAGAEREVVAVDPARDGDWRILVYFDESRTPPPMIWRGALVVAQQAETLTRLGPVRVVGGLGEADDREGGTRETRRVIELLAEVAAKAAEGPRSLPASTADGDRDANASLVDVGMAGCPQAPCLLILVSDGYSTEAASSGLDSSAVGQALSAAGWTVLGLPVVDHDPSQPNIPDSSAQRTWDLLELAPVFRVWPWNRRESRGAGQPLSTLDALTEPRWQPLRTWADLTGGWILRHRDEVPELLGQLKRRHLVSYRSPVTQDEGATSPYVALRVLGEGGDELESPRWVERATAEP
jgi:hypothetical protein